MNKEKLTCKNCNQERDLIYFRITRTRGKAYYNKAKCKVCISKSGECKVIENRIKNNQNKASELKKNISISNECKTFLEGLKRARGYVDTIMAFQLLHYHIQTFGQTSFLTEDVEEQLNMMVGDFIKLKTLND